MNPQTEQAEARAIRAALDRWAEAVRNEDFQTIALAHDPKILMFDVPPPFLSRGLEAYMDTWRVFFANMVKPVSFKLADVEITCGADVAFATARGSCVSLDRTGGADPLDFRLTVGLKKVEGAWVIQHEHHSVPAE